MLCIEDPRCGSKIENFGRIGNDRSANSLYLNKFLFINQTKKNKKKKGVSFHASLNVWWG